MTTRELIKNLKRAPETAEVLVDTFGKELLPITSPHLASPMEKVGAGPDPHPPIVAIRAKLGLGPVRAGELIRDLKMLAGAEAAELYVDNGGGGLLAVTEPRMAPEKERRERSPRPAELVVVIPAKTGLEE